MGFDRRLVAAERDRPRLDVSERQHTMIVADLVVATLGALGRVTSVLSR